MLRRPVQIVAGSLRSIARYPLRSSLLVSSAVLGVCGVVCSVNYGAGGSQQILDQIHRMGTNVLVVTPAQSRAIADRARTGSPVTTLVDRDYLAIKSALVHRTRSSAWVMDSFWSKAGDLSKNAAVVGCEPDYFAIKSWPVSSGEVFDAFQERTSARVALLGYTVAGDLFGTQSPLGRRMLINRVPFTVIGVLAERGQGLDVTNEDSQIYIPLNTAMRRLTNLDHFSGILFELDDLQFMDPAASQIAGLLSQHHHLGANRPDDFNVQNQKSLLDTQLAASRRLRAYLRWVAACALSVSGLGIVAISWISIKERTREIGTRRALGATSADIFLQITVEMLSLAWSGAILGLVVAVPASWLVSDSARLPFVFDGGSAAIACAAAALLNLTFSFIPAWKASSVNPIEALRFE